MLVIHTREGHRPDLADAPPAKVERGAPQQAHRRRRPDGTHPGPRRGGPRHHPGAVRRWRGEPVIDKPGKGAFFATDLHAILHNRGIENLIVGGVTTEVCVHTTVREANDRGYRCVVRRRLLRLVLP